LGYDSVGMIYPVPKPVKVQKKARTYLPKIKKGVRASLEKKATTAWNMAVLKRDGFRCQAVRIDGSKCNALALDPHHIQRRSFKATKWLLENGISLCCYHHREDLTNLKATVLRSIGKERNDRLKSIALNSPIPTDEELHEIIKRLISS